jgi:hypothetical protein
MYESNEVTEYDIDISELELEDEITEDAWDWANSDDQIPW